VPRSPARPGRQPLIHVSCALRAAVCLVLTVTAGTTARRAERRRSTMSGGSSRPRSGWASPASPPRTSRRYVCFFRVDSAIGDCVFSVHILDYLLTRHQ
jgi:hypothetical protein